MSLENQVLTRCEAITRCETQGEDSMKKVIIGLLATTALSAVAADDIVPLKYINSVDIYAQSITMSVDEHSWAVTHSCNLYMGDASDVSVRPAHKTPMLPHRMNRLGPWDSLVITVDGKKNVCDIQSINKVNTQIAAR